MPAFSRHARELLDGAVKKLFDVSDRALLHTITHDEFYQVFVPPEQRDMFRRMEQLAETGSKWAKVLVPARGEMVDVRVISYIVNGRPPVTLPRFLALYDDENPACAAEIMAWVENGGEVARDFGRVAHVLNYLDACCPSPIAVRHLWPSIMALCACDPELDDLAKRMANAKPPKDMVSVPHGMRMALRKTSGTIAGARLLLTNNAPAVVGAGVLLKTASEITFREDDGVTFRGYSG